MAYTYILSLLLTQNLLLSCASAAVHSHSVDNLERETDGSFRARDADHYGDAGHNSEFDHEAILGEYWPGVLWHLLFLLGRARRRCRNGSLGRSSQSLIRDARVRVAMSVKLALFLLAPVMLGVTLYYSIGSVREAEEFDRMSPEQAKAKLVVLVDQMDLNKDKQIDRAELKKWILNSFV